MLARMSVDAPFNSPAPESAIFEYGRASTLLGGGKGAGFVVFGAKTGRTDRGDDCQKLFEGHVQIQETTLAKNPTIVVEDFIGNHQRQARERRDRGKTPRVIDSPRLGGRGHFDGIIGDTVETVAVIPERNHLTSGASRHE